MNTKVPKLNNQLPGLSLVHIKIVEKQETKEATVSPLHTKPGADSSTAQSLSLETFLLVLTTNVVLRA